MGLQHFHLHGFYISITSFIDKNRHVSPPFYFYFSLFLSYTLCLVPRLCYVISLLKLCVVLCFFCFC
jgi:hypothetical protein